MFALSEMTSLMRGKLGNSGDARTRSRSIIRYMSCFPPLSSIGRACGRIDFTIPEKIAMELESAPKPNPNIVREFWVSTLHISPWLISDAFIKGRKYIRENDSRNFPSYMGPAPQRFFTTIYILPQEGEHIELCASSSHVIGSYFDVKTHADFLSATVRYAQGTNSVFPRPGKRKALAIFSSHTIPYDMFDPNTWAIVTCKENPIKTLPWRRVPRDVIHFENDRGVSLSKFPISQLRAAFKRNHRMIRKGLYSGYGGGYIESD